MPSTRQGVLDALHRRTHGLRKGQVLVRNAPTPRPKRSTPRKSRLTRLPGSHPDVATKRRGTRANTGAVRGNGAGRARPIIGQRGAEIQVYGSCVPMPIALDQGARVESAAALNQILADTLALRDLYKKHHWHAAGPTFYPIHLLFDKHYEAQAEIIDEIAERIQTLGGVAIAMAADVAETTRVPRPPRGREELPVQISRLLEAHELIIREVRQAAKAAAARGDDGTNDLLVSDVLRPNELQVWFLAQHLVDAPLVRAD